MIKITFLLVLLSFTSFAQNLIISGIFDGPLPGGEPKVIEFRVLEDISDLSVYGFGSANNGGGSDGEEFTFSGSASTGDFIYVSSIVTNTSNFVSYFGFEPTFTSGAANINGDDAIELFENGVAVDLYGDINTDGTGQDWEYLDGWVYRNNNETASTTFDISDWNISEININDGEVNNFSAEQPFPIGTYTANILSNLEFKTLEKETILFPNPSFKGEVNLITTISSDIETVIYNNLGMKISTQIISKGENIVTENLSSGIYFVQLTIKENTITKKLVIR